MTAPSIAQITAARVTYLLIETSGSFQRSDKEKMCSVFLWRNYTDQTVQRQRKTK
jgi:hypothetical protein